jgi:hypothetical protein
VIWTDEHTERPRRFHGLDTLLAAGTRAQGAAAAHGLHQALAASACVWGFRAHHPMANVQADGPGKSCGRCGYALPAPQEEPQPEGAAHGSASAQAEQPKAARRPRKRRIGLQPGRVTGE